MQVDPPADLATAYLQRARAYGKLGNLARAKEDYEKVLSLWHDADDSPLRQLVSREAKDISLRAASH